MSASANPFAKPKLQGAALAPLVYWLLIVSGLAGITLLRFGSYGSFVTSDDISALWVGSILGVALGQGASAARIRLWVPVVIAMFGFWFLLPILFLVVDGIFGATAQTFLLAFMPAMVCGYLSLTERGALLSFWYPAVLWMIVILDGPVPGTFDQRFALPFVVGLAALFVVYLRARQTRRVAIWKAHASDRLAESMPRTVLRASPIRAAGQHVFSAMTGAAALVLTAWIAPHLWQTVKDPWHGPSSALSSPYASTHGSPYTKSSGKPCCPIGMKKRERVKEYFPLQRAHDTDEDDVPGAQCRVCQYEGTVASTIGEGKSKGRWSYGGTPGSGLSSSGGTTLGNEPFGVSNPWGYGTSYNSGSWNTTTTTGTTDPTTTTTYTTPSTYDPPLPLPVVATQPVTPEPLPVQATTPSATNSTTTPTTSPDPTPAAVTSNPSGPSPVDVTPHEGASLSFPTPWKSSLALCTIAFAFILFSRAVRRALTLRHLAHPFWSESFDQRISNHWERMLVGLRDAGLEPGKDEQPLTFARRIGIEGMEACATILERVRHGVRVDSDDLANMRAAANAVFCAARERAGFVGRATAWLRPPTA